MLASVPADGFGGQQRQPRAQALTAGRQHAPDRLGYEDVVRAERGPEKGLDQRVQVGGGRAAGALDHAVPTWMATVPPASRT